MKRLLFCLVFTAMMFFTIAGCSKVESDVDNYQTEQPDEDRNGKDPDGEKDSGGDDNGTNSDDDGNNEESDESEIRIDEADKSIFFDAKENQQTISFYAAQNWTASIIDDDENEWCSISATSGDAGQSSIEIAVTNNYKTEDRSVSIEIKSGATTGSGRFL